MRRIATLAWPRPGTPRTLAAAASTVARVPATAIARIAPSCSSRTEPTRPQKKPPITATVSGMIARSGMGSGYPRVSRSPTRSGPDEDGLGRQPDAERLLHAVLDLAGEREQLARRAAAAVGEREDVLGRDRDPVRVAVALGEAGALDQPRGAGLHAPVGLGEGRRALRERVGGDDRVGEERARRP